LRTGGVDGRSRRRGRAKTDAGRGAQRREHVGGGVAPIATRASPRRTRSRVARGPALLETSADMARSTRENLASRCWMGGVVSTVPDCDTSTQDGVVKSSSFDTCIVHVTRRWTGHVKCHRDGRVLSHPALAAAPARPSGCSSAARTLAEAGSRRTWGRGSVSSGPVAVGRLRGSDAPSQAIPTEHPRTYCCVLG